MGNKKLDKIMLRIGVMLTVIAIICIIIVPKPSAEFTISIVTCIITLTVSIVAAIRIRMNHDK